MGVTHKFLCVCVCVGGGGGGEGFVKSWTTYPGKYSDLSEDATKTK